MTLKTFLAILKAFLGVFVTTYWVFFSLITSIWSYFTPVLLGIENVWSMVHSFCSLVLIILLSKHFFYDHKKSILNINMGKVVDKPKDVGSCSKCGKKKQKS